MFYKYFNNTQYNVVDIKSIVIQIEQEIIFIFLILLYIIYSLYLDGKNRKNLNQRRKNFQSRLLISKTCFQLKFSILKKRNVL